MECSSYTTLACRPGKNSPISERGTQLNETSNPWNSSPPNPSRCIPLRFNIHLKHLKLIRTVTIAGNGTHVNYIGVAPEGGIYFLLFLVLILPTYITMVYFECISEILWRVDGIYFGHSLWETTWNVFSPVSCTISNWKALAENLSCYCDFTFN